MKLEQYNLIESAFSSCVMAKTRFTVIYWIISVIMVINCGQVSSFQVEKAILYIIRKKISICLNNSGNATNKTSYSFKLQNLHFKWMLYADNVA